MSFGNISDPRTVTDFQNFTFSGHSRKLAIKSLLESIQLGHADYACYWSLELLCSGLVNSLWITLFEGASLSVHRACPNLFTYLITQYETFRRIQDQFDVATMTNIRNRDDARRLVCDAASTVALCRKQKPLNLPTIKPAHDFDPTTIRENLRATSQHLSAAILKQEDPYELQIPVNELCFSLQNRDTIRSLYWTAWIFAFARERKKQSKEALTIAPRQGTLIPQKYSRNLVWLIWDIIHQYSGQSGFVAGYIDCLEKMYCFQWEPSVSRARQTFLVSAIVFLTESQALDIREPAKRSEVEISTVLSGIPRWLESIQETRNSFSSR
uniref:Uncharacterized protein n=1 Tax=viral metagenome TaxID=1070528 RepID=A0A6C0I6T7_9ZZZZ